LAVLAKDKEDATISLSKTLAFLTEAWETEYTA
jgi:hypothetical protein